ncbi:uracil-DNA glycosylase family protein [Agrobacterium radiobacter]|uniref:uracil-DNA glycosylase family protein n=1 Tax=Agrobacterium radiobacter TaxID=362 RepID=UPI003F8478ED
MKWPIFAISAHVRDSAINRNPVIRYVSRHRRGNRSQWAHRRKKTPWPEPREEAVPPAFQPERADASSLRALRGEAESCQRSNLYRHATQLVFGEADTGERVVLVGEQPGNEENLKGRPFVGPAGRLPEECLVVDRSQCYVINAVKHFRFEQRGKRRSHDHPNGGEVLSCVWWLRAGAVPSRSGPYRGDGRERSLCTHRTHKRGDEGPRTCPFDAKRHTSFRHDTSFLSTAPS